jgi:hypothetical protein
MNGQRSQDIDDLIVLSFQFRLLHDCHHVSRQMESVQNKKRVFVSTHDIFNMVYEKLHELDSQIENAANLQLVPRLQNLTLGIVMHISVP